MFDRTQTITYEPDLYIAIEKRVRALDFIPQLIDFFKEFLTDLFLAIFLGILDCREQMKQALIIRSKAMLLTKITQRLADSALFLVVLMVVAWDRQSWWDLTEDQDSGKPKFDLPALFASVWHEIWGPQWRAAPSFVY